MRTYEIFNVKVRMVIWQCIKIYVAWGEREIWGGVISMCREAEAKDVNEISQEQKE